MTRYMELPASIDHILWKLSVIFGMVASFDVFMQNFYKVTQGNNEKVPSFASQVRRDLKSNPSFSVYRRMMAVEEQQYLRDFLFHGAYKHTCNSVWLLYSSPGNLHLQLMVATRKVGSENEETQEKVRD